MTMKHMYIAMLGAAGLLLPAVLTAQMDPMGNSGAAQYPQSPQNINQPVPGATGSTPATGAQSNQTTSMRDSLGAPGQTGQEMLDKQFIRSAAQTGMADLKLATLATQKGGPDVKDLAQKLADDHEAMNKDLDAVADQMGVMLPKKISKGDQAEYDKLNGLQAEVVKALGTMHQHFGMIGKVAKDDGITLPPRPPRPAAATTASK
jgi:putative membrane protein